MNKALTQMVAIWNKLEIAQRVTVALVGIAFVAAAVFLSYGATQPDYRLLAGNLNQGQVAEIGAYLDSLHVKYRVTDHETAVLVPSKELYRLRNDLAERQMLGDGSNGFELLAKNNMWDSTFSEHKNYDRAVAGELERSMKELPGVRSARVIIDRPQPSPFVGDAESQPKASIKLDMNPGEHLNERQIAGIVHLTSGAVANLSPDRVQVMDNAGLLTTNTEDVGAMMAQTSLDAEISREQHLTRKAQDILDATLGPGRSRVKVAVKLDFTKRTEATSNPDLAKPLKETTTTTDEKTPVMGQGGIAGVSSNIPDGGPETTAAISPQATASKTLEETHNEYVVGKKTVTQEDEIGVIKGMTVSILLDYKKPESKKLDDKGKPTDEVVPAEPFSDAEKKQFSQLVSSAIGLEAAKGVARAKDPTAKDLDDRFRVEVQSMGMWTPPAEVAQATVMPTWMSGDMKDYISYGGAALVALALLLVARGQLKRSHKAMLDAEARSRAEAEERERQLLEGEVGQATPKQVNLREMIRKKVQENPAAAAQVIRKWINE